MGYLIAYVLGLLSAVSPHRKTTNSKNADEKTDQKSSGRSNSSSVVPQIPPTLRESEESCKCCHHKAPWWKVVLEILTFVAAAGAAGAAIYYAGVTKRMWGEMQTQSGTAQRQLELSERPWVYETGWQVRQPLRFDSKGNALIDISGILENVGHSPGLRVRSNSYLFAMTMLGSDEFERKETEFCEPLRKLERQVLDQTIFPGDHVASGEGLGVGPDKIKEATTARSNTPFKHDGFASFGIVTCVDYQSSLSNRHYQSRYFFQVAEPRGIASMIDFRPQGSYPKTTIEIVSQMAD